MDRSPEDAPGKTVEMGSRILHLHTLLYGIHSHLSSAHAEFLDRGELTIYSLVARVQMVGILERLSVILGP